MCRRWILILLLMLLVIPATGQVKEEKREQIQETDRQVSINHDRVMLTWEKGVDEKRKVEILKKLGVVNRRNIDSLSVDFVSFIGGKGELELEEIAAYYLEIKEAGFDKEIRFRARMQRAESEQQVASAGEQVHPADVQPAGKVNGLSRVHGRGDFYNQPWRHFAFIPSAHKLSKQKKEVIVAYVFVGADYTHPGVRNNLWVNKAEKNGTPGVDDDGNGHVDDIYGYDFYDMDGDPKEEGSIRESVGTAAVINATANHSDIAWDKPGKVKQMILRVGKFVPSGFGYYVISREACISALEYARKNGADVICWPYGYDYDYRLEQQIKAFKGLVVTSPATPDSDYFKDFPTGYGFPNVITNGWFYDKYSLWTNWRGKNSIELAASAGDYTARGAGGFAGGYTDVNDAKVAASAAHLMSVYPDFSVQKIKEILISSVDEHQGWKDYSITGGSLNLHKAVLGRSVGGKVATDDWTETNTTPAGRHAHAIAFDSVRGRVVIHGGLLTSDTNGVFDRIDDTWEWDGRRWHKMKYPRKKGEYPGFRAHAVMAFDSRRGVCVLFGGSNPDPDNDWETATFEWDGQRWSRINVVEHPPLNGGGQMIFDSRRGVMVLFGGGAFKDDFKNVWEYDGINWEIIKTRTNPPTRFMHSLVFDERRGIIIVFGGKSYNNVDVLLDDLWEYDGVDWKEIKRKGPMPRRDAAFIYDSLINKSVLLGGTHPYSWVYPFEWTWDGKKWELIGYRSPARTISGEMHGIWNSRKNRIETFDTDSNENFINHSWSGSMPATFIDNLVVAGGDYTGDGRADIALWNPNAAELRVQGKTPVKLGEVGDIPVPGDYNGDGKVEFALYRRSTGTWIFQDKAVKFGQFRDIPVPADYNGDGTTDIAVYRPDTASWHFQDGKSKDQGHYAGFPVPGDYNGDGKIQVATYSALDATWKIEGMEDVQYGQQGDSPVPADYDGDGRMDIAIWRPQTKTFLVRSWNDGKNLIKKQIGTRHAIPVPGDYNGDGKAQPATFTPWTGTWHIDGKAPVKFGTMGDVPLVRGK